MKRIKRFLSTLCIGVLILLQVPVMNISAAPAGLDAGTYAGVMSSTYASYFIKSQPNNAIVLADDTVLQDTDIYTSYGYWFLPRLNYQYYYLLETNDYFTLNPQLNAIHIIREVDETNVVKLSICSTATNRSLADISIHTDSDYTLNQSVESPKTSANIKTYTCKSTYYNPAIVFVGGFVTPDYIGIPADNLGTDTIVNATLYWDGTKVDEVNPNGIVDLAQYDSTLETIKLTFDGRDSVQNTMCMSKLATYYLQSDDTDILPLFACTETNDGFSYQPLNPGDTSSKISFSFICNKALLVLEFDSGASLSYKNTYKASPGNSIDLAGDASAYVSQIDGDPNVPTGTTYSNGTLYVNSGFTGDITTVGKSFAGFTVSKLSKVTSEWPANSYKIVFAESSDYSLSPLMATCGQTVSMPTPVKENYLFMGWFTDKQCQTAFNAPSYAAGETVTVYPKWEYSGGYYSVRFYDGYNNKTDTKSFKVSEQPALPTNPTYTGYTFKYWTIVNSLSDTSGKTYDPSTFTPKADGTYIFKAVYAVTGVIKEVVNSQSSYYVGQSIDKNKLTVVAIVDDNGNTRNLNADEYELSPSTVTSEGTTTVTVKYTATGATATFKVSGSKDPLALLTVKYSGGDLVKGTAIPTSQITVYGSYGSGKTEQLTGWTISPTTITKIGTNNIKVTYAHLSANLIINGTESTASSTDKKEVSSIIATYIGPTLIVGDKIVPANIKVTATYKDGTVARLESTAFSYTPNIVRAAGANTVMVNYDGYSAICTIEAQEKTGSATTASGTSSSNRNNTSSSSTGNQNTAADDKYTFAGALNSKTAKGVSPYYIKGRTILNISTASGLDEHSVDIVSILKDAEENSAVTLNLYNGNAANILDSNGFSILHSKSLVLYVNMLDEYSLQPVAYWVVNGKLSESIAESISFNVNMVPVNKASETMYAISVGGSSYPIGTTVVMDMPGAFPIGTYTRLYATDVELNNSHLLQDSLWGDTDSLNLPLSNCPYYVITDLVTLYPDGSDMCEELIADVTNADAEDQPDIDEDGQENVASDDTQMPSQVDTTKHKTVSALGVLCIVMIGITVIVGVIALAKVYVLRKHKTKK